MKCKLACMELMWGSVSGEKFEPWLREIQAIGFTGIGCRSTTLDSFFAEPQKLHALLKNYGLELASVYSEVHVDFVRYEAICKFMRAMKCDQLVLHGGRGPSKADREIMAKLLDHIGALAARFGVKATFHHHTNTFSETMEQTEHVLSLTRPEHFHVFCDVGHATKDFIESPVKDRARIFLERNWKRLQLIEFKDWRPNDELSIEVGQGEADYASIFALLHERKYAGWIVFEQNSPNNGKTAGECARGSFEFVKKHFVQA